MASAGASETDRQVAFALALIERDQEIEQAPDLVDKALRLRLRHHVLVHARVDAGERAQLGNEKWIRNEPHVEHQVHPDRQAVLVAERHDRDRPSAIAAFAPSTAAVTISRSSCTVSVVGVDDAIGALAHLGQRETLHANPLGDGRSTRSHRMRPAALGIAAREHVVGRVEKNYFWMNSVGARVPRILAAIAERTGARADRFRVRRPSARDRVRSRAVATLGASATGKLSTQ